MGSSGRTIEEQKKKQNEDFFELRGKLKLNTKRDDRIAILKTNGQFVPEGNSEVKYLQCQNSQAYIPHVISNFVLLHRF